ncbi:MAG: hypothetical protein ABSH39_22125, partial [Candidatus Acidiferrum sp.]
TGDTPTIMGGNIIGVGSKINQSSIIVYETATNYRLFEFVWDPSKDMGLTGGAGSMIGAPAGGIPGGGTSPGSLGGFGQNPAGGTPSGTTPPPTPPTTPPTSTPQQ